MGSCQGRWEEKARSCLIRGAVCVPTASSESPASRDGHGVWLRLRGLWKKGLTATVLCLHRTPLLPCFFFKAILCSM